MADGNGADRRNLELDSCQSWVHQAVAGQMQRPGLGMFVKPMLQVVEVLAPRNVAVQEIIVSSSWGRRPTR